MSTHSQVEADQQAENHRLRQLVLRSESDGVICRMRFREQEGV